MLGFNAGTALSTPRYLQALADERLVPRIFSRLHARFDTPAAAIVTTALATLVLSVVLDFGKLVDLAVLAVLCQYFATAAALVRLGKTPGKKALGAVSLVISAAFARESNASQFVALGAVLGLGVVVAVATSALRKGGAPRKTVPSSSTISKLFPRDRSKIRGWLHFGCSSTTRRKGRVHRGPWALPGKRARISTVDSGGSTRRSERRAGRMLSAFFRRGKAFEPSAKFNSGATASGGER